MIWAAGRGGSPLGASLGVPLDRAGRVHVEPDLSLPGHPEVFVVGDLALIAQACPASPLPRSRWAAMPREISFAPWRRSRATLPLQDYGQLATIGRNAAVAMLGKLHLSGYLAWLTWLVAHIYFLINFRNRLVVMIDWAWAYWTFERHARIVLREIPK